MESEREEVKNGGVEEDERALKRKREKEWAAASSPPQLDDITDDQDNAFKVRGKNSRRIEVCRDCPYLDTVIFKVADCTTKHYPENSFRDTILHIQHCSRLSSSGLNQEAKCSSATTVRAPKLHLPSFQSTSSREDMISLMFKLMGSKRFFSLTAEPHRQYKSKSYCRTT
ncbi:unnamed protein product [Brassica oleracea var. botrytis]